MTPCVWAVRVSPSACAWRRLVLCPGHDELLPGKHVGHLALPAELGVHQVAAGGGEGGGDLQPARLAGRLTVDAAKVPRSARVTMTWDHF